MTAPATAVTTREHEVLDLLAQHLTNAQIADTLHISVRTVESHVSALLRKLQLPDRRSLARAAAAQAAAVAPGRGLPHAATSFVGRVAERHALRDAVAAHRMVTATGPGGVGKTRLVVAVAAEIAGEQPDGVTFVDLVHVTDPSMVAAAIAEACGVPERHGTTVEAALHASLARRAVLLVIDNCEHLLDGVRDCLDAILVGCPDVRVLATSRARLLTPYEHVYAVPAMSTPDAVALFTVRAAAAGEPFLDRGRVATLCRALDGMALAIELAAARCASLGLDGLEAGLDQRLRFLTAGGRVADRHRSLRNAIAWSYELLDAEDRRLLRTMSVFAGWFDVAAAAALGGTGQAAAADGLARLAEQSLLLVDRGIVTRYRALESIRQFGAEQLAADGALDEVRARHLRWCRHAMTTLDPGDGWSTDDDWCAAVDAVLDDVRVALRFSESDDVRAGVTADLAAALARVLYVRGRPTEAQRRFEQAAAVAPDPAGRPALLRLAAGAAGIRHVGLEALALLQAAADLAAARGEHGDAACDLAAMSTLVTRNPGIMADPPTMEDALRMLESARRRSDGSERARAAVAVATAFYVEETAADADDLAAAALAAARRAGDHVLASVALDQVCGIGLARDDLAGAAAAIVAREHELARDLPVDASTGFELGDFALMASEVALAVGDLTTARRHADALARLPFYRGDAHLSLARRLKVDAMAGHLEEVAELGERFRLDWVRAGRPVASNLASTAGAVAMVHGLRGDDIERRRWRTITETLFSGLAHHHGLRSAWAPTFDGMFALHVGDVTGALAVLAADIDDDAEWGVWHRGMWRPWYGAMWAEAAVLGREPTREDRLRRARTAARDNPIAAALVDRAAAIDAGRTDVVAALATTFDDLGCVYQRDRSRRLADVNSPA